MGLHLLRQKIPEDMSRDPHSGSGAVMAVAGGMRAYGSFRSFKRSLMASIRTGVEPIDDKARDCAIVRMILRQG